MAGRKTDFNIPEDASRTKPKVAIGRPMGGATSSFFDVFYDEEEDKPDFKNHEKRKRFVTIVFVILTIQLLLTVFCTVPFVINEEAKNLVMENSWVIWVSVGVLVVPYLMLFCCDSNRREWPTNTVLLLILTLGLAATCACCSAWFQTVVVLYTAALTTLVTFLITVLTCCSRRDYTKAKWAAIMMLVFLVLFAGLAVVLSFMFPDRLFATFIYPGVLVALFTAFLLHDANAIMAGHRLMHMAPDEYVCGAAQIYVDIVGMFVWFLETVGTPTDTD